MPNHYAVGFEKQLRVTVSVPEKLFYSILVLTDSFDKKVHIVPKTYEKERSYIIVRLTAVKYEIKLVELGCSVGTVSPAHDLSQSVLVRMVENCVGLVGLVGLRRIACAFAWQTAMRSLEGLASLHRPCDDLIDMIVVYSIHALSLKFQPTTKKEPTMSGEGGCAPD